MSVRRDQHDSRTPPRSEPTLGDLDQLDTPRAVPPDGLPQVRVEPRRPPGRTTTRPPRRHRRWLIPLLVLLLVALLGGLWLSQTSLRAMLPRTDLNNVLTQAQQALQDGRLDGQDGTSARELFQQVAALEPDNDRARRGLREVGQAELAQADTALQAGQIGQATQQAALARELLGGGSDVDRLDLLIRQAHGTQAQTVSLIDQAQQALAAGKLDGSDGAGALFQRVLRDDSGNAVAAHGLDQVSNALAVQAHQAFDAKDIPTADVRIEQLAALQPNNGALPALRALQAQTRKQASDALDTALEQGQDALRAGNISGAGDDSALARYQAALTIDPNNPQARAGLGKVAQALTVQANAALDAGDAAQAGKLLDQAAPLAPKSADLAAARARLVSLHSTSTTAPNTTAPGDAPIAPAVMLLSPQQSAAVAMLVQRAQLATRNGNIMMPPGDCAYDLYRSALAIDGNNVPARQGLQGLSGEVEKQFNQSLAAGRLGEAGSMLANLDELSPGDAGRVTLGNRLASGWLDKAEQQLARGDRAEASQSLEHARKLAPNQPRVIDLSAQLQGNP
ncbi:MAG: hypothetical protein ABI268_03180 [Rhodanobacter sp.]